MEAIWRESVARLPIRASERKPPGDGWRTISEVMALLNKQRSAFETIARAAVREKRWERFQGKAFSDRAGRVTTCIWYRIKV